MLTTEQHRLLDRLARRIVELRMSTPAIFFLESVEPLNYVGSQVMLFFQPVAKVLFAGSTYDEVQRLLEERESIEALLRKIEAGSEHNS